MASFRKVTFALALVGSLGALLNFVSVGIAFLPSFDLRGGLPTPQDLMILLASNAIWLAVPALGFLGAAISYFKPRAGGPVLLAATLASLAWFPDWPSLTLLSVTYFSGTVLFFIATMLAAFKADTWVKTEETETLQEPQGMDQRLSRQSD